MSIKRFVLGELSTNCYVISDDETNVAAIIDPAGCNERLTKYIDEARLEIIYILLTHTHFDHIMGCAELVKRYGAKVLIGKAEATLIDTLNSGFTNELLSSSVKADETLSEGDVVNIGTINLNVIETPGHTPGGITFYTDGVMFSGDTLFKLSVGRTDFCMGDFNQLSQSVKKLYKYPDETVVYPGHGFTTTIGSEKLSNPYVKE